MGSINGRLSRAENAIEDNRGRGRHGPRCRRCATRPAQTMVRRFSDDSAHFVADWKTGQATSPDPCAACGWTPVIIEIGAYHGQLPLYASCLGSILGDTVDVEEI